MTNAEHRMNLEDRVLLFSRLGDFLKENLKLKSGGGDADFDRILRAAGAANGWFTPREVERALTGISDWLNESNLRQWVSDYTALQDVRAIKAVGIIMAGNIPAVGFHDLLCVILSGHKAVCKPSTDDSVLMRYLIDQMIRIDGRIADFVEWKTERLGAVDAVIATGSNNTARYFEYYFGKKPHIIRKNRHSVAVLDGSETSAQLQMLGQDIFSYYGMGCRSVSKLFVQEKFDVTWFYPPIEGFAEISDNHKYENNYTYNKTVYLMQQTPIWDNGFLVLKEDVGLGSPIGVIYFERYSGEAKLADRLNMDRQNIQCVVGNGHIPFGHSQSPMVNDYADGVDTMDFLSRL